LIEEREITQVGEIDAPDINAWFVHMRKTSGGHGKPRSERTIQTYARSARAFFHWLVRRETIDRNPFDCVTFPKVGKPLIRPIEPQEFERLLLACTPPGEVGPLANRAAARNRAILCLLYDIGIRLSELFGLKLADFDHKHGILIVKGKGSKERRVAVGKNCLGNLLYYLDRHQPDEEELAEWGNASQDHIILHKGGRRSTLYESPLQLTCYKRWYEFIAFFCMSLFVMSGNAPEFLEPIDEALSTVAFLVSLAIEPTPSVVLSS
jgi:site-specific recombinase XerD